MELKRSAWRVLILGATVSLLMAFTGGVASTRFEGAAPPNVLYAAPAGAGECTSWSDACTLQSALAAATAGKEIWVAAGTHLPTTPGGRLATFQLKSGVGVYGGFAGTEDAREERDWVANLTVLSGDIGTQGDDSDNSYHVVTGSNTDPTAVLDGFTISAGNANGAGTYGYGGGMYNVDGSPTLANVTFRNNNSGDYGGGMYNSLSSPALTDVIFSGNSTPIEGGGMFNIDSSPTLTNVTFLDNTAGLCGGGMHNYGGSIPTLTNVVFSGNQALAGGGMRNEGSSPQLTNVSFSGNSASWGGGMDNLQSNPVLANVTFSGNEATFHGGGLVNGDSSNTTVTNCILWGNSAAIGDDQIWNDSSTLTVSYSLVQGCAYSGGGWQSGCGDDGGHNLDADPQFVDADGPDDVAGTPDDDLRLGASSPAIDAGNNAAVPVGIAVDLAGHARFVDVPTVADSGAGTPPIVDMGAYEALIKTHLPLVMKQY